MSKRKSVTFENVKPKLLVIESDQENTSPRDSEGEVGPETQKICDDLQFEAENQSKEESLPENQEELNENSLMIHLEMIWIPTTLIILSKLFEMCLQESTQMYNLTCKRFFTKTTTIWKKAFPKIIHKNKHLFKNCSWEAFSQRLRDVALYTTLCQLELTEDIAILFKKCHEQIIKDPSSSSAITKTTCKLATTARGTVTALDVPELSILEEEPSAIDELFGPTSSQQNTGSISQNISKMHQGQLSSWKSPGERWLTVVKLDTYQFSKGVNMDRKNWWKHATIRSCFLISSPADPKHIMVERLMNQAARDLKKIPEIKKETKEI